MRALTIILAVSLAFAPILNASNEIDFDQEPIITVDLEPSDTQGSYFSIYFYSAIGVMLLYTIASIKFETISRFNRAAVSPIYELFSSRG